jgi:hypothetical protein
MKQSTDKEIIVYLSLSLAFRAELSKGFVVDSIRYCVVDGGPHGIPVRFEFGGQPFYKEERTTLQKTGPRRLRMQWMHAMHWNPTEASSR